MRVLFVCTGNICRSPTAEGVFRRLVQDAGLAHAIEIDSAGTGAWHAGEPPDARSQEAAARRGIDLGAQRARPVHRDDFHAFDVILAMDRGHLRQLQRAAPPGATARIELLLDHAPEHGRDVPDPYYGAGDGFERVLDMIEAAGTGLLAALREDIAAPD